MNAELQRRRPQDGSVPELEPASVEPDEQYAVAL